MPKIDEFRLVARELNALWQRRLSVAEVSTHPAYRDFQEGPAFSNALRRLRGTSLVGRDSSAVYNEDRAVEVATEDGWTAWLSTASNPTESVHSLPSNSLLDCVAFSDHQPPIVQVWEIKGPTRDLSRLDELLIKAGPTWSPSSDRPLELLAEQHAISFVQRDRADVFLRISQLESAPYILKFDPQSHKAVATTYADENSITHMLFAHALSAIGQSEAHKLSEQGYFDGLLALIDAETLPGKLAPELHYAYAQLIGRLAPNRIQPHLRALHGCGNQAIAKRVEPYLEFSNAK